jgi:hypothetical protein
MLSSTYDSSQGHHGGDESQSLLQAMSGQAVEIRDLSFEHGDGDCFVADDEGAEADGHHDYDEEEGFVDAEWLLGGGGSGRGGELGVHGSII